MAIERFGSGGPYEDAVGYSRAVRADRHVWVAGCTAVDADGVVLGGDDVHAQTVEALRALERALALAGARLEHVVRTRLFVTDASRWQDVGRAHAAAFGEHRPVTAMIEVSGFLDPRMLVEIEADAYIPPAD